MTLKTAACLVTLILCCAGPVAAQDANGDRPDLSKPPLPSPREPVGVSVPDVGSSALLLGLGLLGVGVLRRWLRGEPPR